MEKQNQKLHNSKIRVVQHLLQRASTVGIFTTVEQFDSKRNIRNTNITSKEDVIFQDKPRVKWEIIN